MPYGNQPHKCVCFGGFCMKNLCHQRTINKAQAKLQHVPVCETPKPSTTIRPAKGIQILVTRDDVTYEGYTLPPGRIPQKR
jgi:hypothetical protein